ncbi:MAG: sensor histidine kinase [Candidatus Thorarchaeota archaeon]|jgi:signal transduction histidine kinase
MSKQDHPSGSSFLSAGRRVLIEPSNKIQSDILRIKTELLSLSLFLIVIILPIVQIFLGIFFDNLSRYILATSAFFTIYLISRTKYAKVAGVITTMTLAIMPYVFLLSQPVPEQIRVTLNIIIWPVIAVLFGSQWLSAKYESILICCQTVGLLVFCNAIPSIGLGVAIEPIIDQLAISLVILIFAWSLNYYLDQLEDHKQYLEQRSQELEVYTSVLTHDLGNDMQIIKGLIELMDEKDGTSKDSIPYVSTSLAVSERMTRVIKLFSAVGRGSDYDFLETIQRMADRAKDATGRTQVSLFVEPKFESSDIRPGILLPLVLENLIRNTVEYAGEGAVVTIRLGLVQNNLIITYRDNGPGIDPKIRSRLFMKGASTKGEERGLGLYLSKRIVESYGGTIELFEEKESQGATFIISVPFRF